MFNTICTAFTVITPQLPLKYPKEFSNCYYNISNIFSQKSKRIKNYIVKKGGGGYWIGGVKRRGNHLQLKSRKSSNEFTTVMRLQEKYKDFPMFHMTAFNLV